MVNDDIQGFWKDPSLFGDCLSVSKSGPMKGFFCSSVRSDTLSMEDDKM